MASKVEICNMALMSLGASKILSLDEKSEEAAVCNAFYDTSRRAALRAHPWGFAVKVGALAPIDGFDDCEWSVAYQLPSACLRALKVLPETSQERPNPFEVRGGRILCDVEGATLKYISDITDANAFDALFTDALAWRLAFSAAVHLKGTVESQKYAYEMFMRSLATALAADASEARPERVKSILDAR